MVERLVPTESGVVALHREVSGFQRDDAECFAFFVAQFSRFGTRPVALIREARNFVSKSKWPVRSLPLLQLNTGTMKFTSYEAQAIEPLVSNSPFLAWMYQILSVRAFFEFSRCSRDCNRNPDSSPADLGHGLSHRELAGCGDVLYDSELHDHDVTDLGGEHGRIPGSLGRTRTVSAEGMESSNLEIEDQVFRRPPSCEIPATDGRGSNTIARPCVCIRVYRLICGRISTPRSQTQLC